MSFQEMRWRELAYQICQLAKASEYGQSVHGARVNFLDWADGEPLNIDFNKPDIQNGLLRAADQRNFVGDTVFLVSRVRRPIYIEGCYDMNPGASIMAYMVMRKVQRKPAATKS